MSATQTVDESKLEDFASKVAADQNAGTVAVLAYIADRLGLWSSLAKVGSADATGLAERTGLDELYLAEWLAAMASAEYVAYEPATGEYSLPEEHALVLADEDSPFALAGGFEFQAGCWADADRVADRFVAGGGISWSERDARIGSGVARFFRPLYRQALVEEWLPALEGVMARLESGGRVLDLGCGQGTATSLLARRFPNSDIVGVDSDQAAVAAARERAGESGLENLSFRVVAAEDHLGGPWDLICVFDAFHHFGAPVEAAERIREGLAGGGTVMIVEPFATDSIEENLAKAGPLYYAPSTILCIPDALSDGAGTAIGAQAGPGRLTSILTEAGFGSVRLAAETDFNLVLEARP